MRATIVALAVGVALAAAQIAGRWTSDHRIHHLTRPLRRAPRPAGNVPKPSTVDIRALSYFDADGNLTRRIAHVTVDGFYIKESTGEALRTVPCGHRLETSRRAP